MKIWIFAIFSIHAVVLDFSTMERFRVITDRKGDFEKGLPLIALIDTISLYSKNQDVCGSLTSDLLNLKCDKKTEKVSILYKNIQGEIYTILFNNSKKSIDVTVDEKRFTLERNKVAYFKGSNFSLDDNKCRITRKVLKAKKNDYKKRRDFVAEKKEKEKKLSKKKNEVVFSNYRENKKSKRKYLLESLNNIVNNKVETFPRPVEKIVYKGLSKFQDQLREISKRKLNIGDFLKNDKKDGVYHYISILKNVLDKETLNTFLSMLVDEFRKYLLKEFPEEKNEKFRKIILKYFENILFTQNPMAHIEYYSDLVSSNHYVPYINGKRDHSLAHVLVNFLGHLASQV